MLKRIGKAFLALLSGQVLMVLVQLLLVPLFLRFWSPVVYGEWLALSSLVNYLSTFNFGMDMAVVNRMTQAYGKGDIESFKKAQHTGMAFYLIVAVGGSVILVIVLLLLPFPLWLGLKEIGLVEAAWVAGLLGMQVLWAFPLGLVIDTYRTTGDLATSQWIRNGRQLLASSLVATALLLGAGVRFVASMQVLSLAITATWVLWDLRRRFPKLMPGVSRAELSEGKDLFRPSLNFFLITMAVALSEQGSVLVISSTLGGAAVAVFVTSRTLVNLIRQFLGILNSALWPELTMTEARDEYGQLRLMHRFLTGASTSIVIGYAALLGVYGTDIIHGWTGGRLVPDKTLLMLLLLRGILQSAWMSSGVIAAATNRHGTLAKAYFISSATGLSVAILLIGQFGVSAIPIALMVGEGLACYHFVIRDACRIVRISYFRFAPRLWATLVAMAAAAGLVAWGISVAGILPPPIQWVVAGFFGLGTAFAISWWLWLDSAERALGLSLALRLKRKMFQGSSLPIYFGG